jgi:hypothetical protein
VADGRGPSVSGQGNNDQKVVAFRLKHDLNSEPAGRGQGTHQIGYDADFENSRDDL